MVKTLYSALAAVLATSAVALPSNKGNNKGSPASTTAHAAAPTCTGIQHVANFDDLLSIPGDAFQTVPTPYDGLYFQAFDYATSVLGGLGPGTVPHSGSNFGVVAVPTETTAGTPMLTVNYPESNVTSFSLQNFYYGCTLNTANGAAGSATQCNIEFSAYRGSDNTVSSATEVCAQQFQYNPTTALGPQQMAYSQQLNSCFDNVQFVTITFSLPGGLSVANAALVATFDDFRFATFPCK